MSNTDELELKLVIDEIEQPTPKKKVKKPRKPMSAEHKAKLLLSLAKAREQSCLKRGLKSQAKKILKEKDEAETNEIIRKSLLAKDVEDPRDVQIRELKARLDGLTLQDVVKKPKAKPKPIPEPQIISPIPKKVNFKSLRGSKMNKY
tara:strand:- start:164 stop:604 length:441 start_codon:yes stop_codon:yes gene_type:complete